MAIYNSYIECENAWRSLGLNEEQYNELFDINKGWNPEALYCDLSRRNNILGWTKIVSSWDRSVSPRLYFNRADIDRMTADQNEYMEFVFVNNTSLRFSITGTSGSYLDIAWTLINLTDNTGAMNSSRTTNIPYNEINVAENKSWFVIPYFAHWVDSYDDPTWSSRECGIAISNDNSLAYLMSDSPLENIRIDVDRFYNDSGALITYVAANIFNENNWSGIPDWFWSENEATVNVEYPEEEEDGDEGGYPTDDFGSDIIPIPDFPTVSALGSELVNVYTPSLTDVQNFSAWLWNSTYETNVKKLQASPMENLITFGFVPNGADNNPINSVADTIHIGGIDSAIASNSATTQYIEIDCGHIDVGEVHGSYLDYDTEFQIYLPYIGYKPLSVDDVLPYGIDIKYHMDILTGIVQAYITGYVKDKTDSTYKLSLLYSYVGNCFTELPISAANYTRMKQGQMNAIVNTVSNFGSSVLKGDVFGAATSIIHGKQQYDIQRPEFEHGGSLAGNVLFTFRKPYVIRSCYNYVPVQNYKSYKGIPCVTYHTLKKLKGFTQIDSVVTDTLTHCTKSEKESIVNLLKEGVIL